MKTQETPLNDVKINQFSAKWAKQRGVPVQYLEQTKSTHEHAKQHIFDKLTESEPCFLTLTDIQTKGRGRGTNAWTVDQDGSCLLTTWGYFLPETPHPTLPIRVGLGLYKAAISTWPFLEWSMKAPNDLLLEGNKIAGLLTEIVSQGNQSAVFISLGMNVWSSPKEVQDAISLLDCLPEDCPLLADDWVNFLDHLSFELTECILKSNESLTFCERQSVVFALNLNPNVTDTFEELDPKGNLKTKTQTLSWLKL
jgi:BirA family biotin operon repressor/biotin-[acetyl-CoA-carboxylase] ligase